VLSGVLTLLLLPIAALAVLKTQGRVGCSSLGTFSSRFTELVGMPPSTNRRDAARPTTGMPPCVAM
jgi:methylphosphotriester-DNA--protein-cysteine methyltransferase